MQDVAYVVFAVAMALLIVLLIDLAFMGGVMWDTLIGAFHF
jgi:hypothetical protein